MYFYQNMAVEDLSPAKSGSQIWANSYYQTTPAAVPLDITLPGNPVITTSGSFNNKVAWFKNANITTTYTNWIGYGFVTGKSELYPIPQASIDANGNLRPQNPGY